MDSIGLYINKITKKIRNIDTSNKSDMLYIQEITNPLFKLTDHIITQVCYPNSYQARLNLLQLLSTLLKLSPKQVKPQLEQSTKFAQFLVASISKLGTTRKGEESFRLFINSFTIDIYKKYLTEYFIKLLFESLMLYDDTEIIQKQIYILIDINLIDKSINTNLFLKIYHDYPNFRQIQELLLEMLNKEKNKDAIYKMVVCIINMIDKEEYCIFYSNDLQIVIDIILNSLQTTYSDMIKECMLELLKRITLFDDYFRKLYRLDELTDLLEDYAMNSDQSKIVKSISKQALSNIAIYLHRKIKEDENIMQ